MKYLFLSILICCHYLTVEGSYEARDKMWIDDDVDVTVRVKLIIDIIENKDLKDVIFITDDDITDELVKINSLLQVNSTITSMILRDIFEEISTSLPWLHTESSLSEMMYDMEIKEQKEFTYFILPTIDSSRNVADTLKLIKGLRKSGIRSNLIVLYEAHNSLLNEIWSFRQPNSNLNDIYLYEPENGERKLYHIYGICDFCYPIYRWDPIEMKPRILADTVSNLTYINSWMVSHGFKYPLEFSPSFLSNFHGRPLRINVEMHPTTVWYDENDKAYVGPLYKDLMVLGDMMNFKLLFNPVKWKCEDSLSAGTIDPSRRARDPAKSKGDFSLLKLGSIDIVGGDFIASHEVSQDADITAPMFYQAGANIVSVEPLKTFKWYAILQPFEWYIWALVLGSIPITGTFLYFLRKYADDADKPSNWFNSTWDVIAIVCMDRIRCSKPPIAFIIFLSSLMLSSLFLAKEYTESFTSLIITPSYVRPPVDYVEQLWKTNRSWLGGRMTDYYADRFKDVTDIETRLKLIRWKQEEPEVPTALRELLARPDDLVYFERAGLVEWSVCRYGIDLKGRKLYYSSETIGDYSTFMYLKKRSVTTESFNRKILMLQDIGIIQYHQEIFNDEQIKRECRIEVKDEKKMITLFHLYTGFYLLIAGFTFALISLLAEIITKFEVKKVRRKEVKGTNKKNENHQSSGVEAKLKI